MNRERFHKEGFTLVELIVVLVILAILAAVLVPALLGYIDRAKEQQYIIEAKELMTAAQAGIAEAYGFDSDQFKADMNKNVYKKAGGNYAWFSSYLLATNQGKASSDTTTTKDIITKRMLEYIESRKEDGNARKYQFATPYVPNGGAVSVAKNQQMFLILYNKHGVILMQYARDGKLVTYDGKSFKVENGGSWIKYR